MDGWPNEDFSYKPRASLIESSLKNCETTAFSQVNQTIAPVLDHWSLRHRCIVGNVVFVRCGPVLIMNQCDPSGRREPFRGPDVARGP